MKKQSVHALVYLGVLGFFVGVVGGWVLVDAAEQSLGPVWVGAMLALAPRTFGAIIWAIEGFDYPSIASWTIPLVLLDIVTLALLSGPVSTVFYLASVAVLMIMIFTEVGPRVWLRLVRLDSVP